MKPEDLNWSMTSARLSELRTFRDHYYDLVMEGTSRDELIDRSFDYFRERIRELEDQL